MDLRIVFMGTPGFAVPSLNILLENGYNVVGVITATDKLGGRGKKKVIESEVKKFAKSKGLNILQPSNLKAHDFVETLRSLNANLQIIVAFRMLPEVVWGMPVLGTFNLHGSLLPKYRGAAPINWAVINGDQETGVTTFFLKKEIDTGDLIFQERMPIGPDETTGEVHDKMMMLGAETVLKTVKVIENDEVQTQKQDDSQATKAPKIFHETCEINFDQPSQIVHNFIRGMSPFPAAWTILDDKKLKITRAKFHLKEHQLVPGTFVTDNKNYLHIATQDGFIEVELLQLQGRKRMDILAFLNGYTIE
ncbi:MAG: methionyl-tRNA formyltransferase [Bacteroidota bacterium]